MRSMENMLRLGALTGSSASRCGPDDRWEIAEARRPVRDWLELRGGEEMPGSRCWKEAKKTDLEKSLKIFIAFPTTSEPALSTQSLHLGAV